MNVLSCYLYLSLCNVPGWRRSVTVGGSITLTQQVLKWEEEEEEAAALTMPWMHRNLSFNRLCWQTWHVIFPTAFRRLRVGISNWLEHCEVRVQQTMREGDRKRYSLWGKLLHTCKNIEPHHELIIHSVHVCVSVVCTYVMILTDSRVCGLAANSDILLFTVKQQLQLLKSFYSTTWCQFEPQLCSESFGTADEHNIPTASTQLIMFDRWSALFDLFSTERHLKCQQVYVSERCKSQWII